MRNVIFAMTLVLAACKTINPTQHPTRDDGYEAGNGGNVVVCRDPQGAMESVELLDFYEGRALPTKHHPALGPSGWSQIEKARYALKRLARLDGARAEEYTKRVENFFGAATFVKDQILPDTKDYGWVPVDANCRIEQIAVQKRPKGGGETRYTVNSDLWNLLNSDHQAGLILHEVVYRDALAKGHKNSINTRHYNALLASNQFTTMSTDIYRDMVDRLALGDAPTTSHPPYWVMNPVPVGACVNRPVEANLAAFAHDPNGRALSFSLVEGPAWGTVAADGIFRGTPEASSLGENKFTARVKNDEGLTADTVVRVGVTNCEHGAPAWISPKIDLGVASEDAMFALDLRPYVRDPSGSALTFSATSLPSWLSIEARGVLIGTPRRPDVGVFTGVRLTVTGPGGTATVEAYGEVVKVTHPPKWTSSEIVLPDIKERQLMNFDLAHYVLNPEGSNLQYSLLTGPSFINLTTFGVFVAKPQFADLGEHTARVRLTTGQLGDIATLRFRVVRDARPPVWLQNPVVLGDAKAGTPYSLSIGSHVYDLDGLPLSFQKISGPAWVTVGADGAVMGTPMMGDVGAASMVVRANNPSGLGAEATVTINVR